MQVCLPACLLACAVVDARACMLRMCPSSHIGLLLFRLSACCMPICLPVCLSGMRLSNSLSYVPYVSCPKLGERR
ncbi:unnamed protein product [Periconia digitata]|uniref:Secreted protein n=1 Tax=Periconia digitata TaxID=1303443 RepID=A0A9W4U8Q1_9PLEO|nr:unnamed protein product [Periconia digitata]